MQSVNILIQALEQYEGTYVVVSHDRFFVSQIANKIWYIEDEQIKQYPGTYDEYEWWMEERKADAGKQAPASTKSAPSANGTSNGATPKPPASGPLPNEDERKEWQRTLKRLSQQAEESEVKIGQLEERKQRLEVELADSATYGDDKLMQAKNDEYRRVMAQIGQLQDEWEIAMLEAEEWEKKLG